VRFTPPPFWHLPKGRKYSKIEMWIRLKNVNISLLGRIKSGFGTESEVSTPGHMPT
jgi:hypothetical protein